jgi:hypothetical protein
MGWGQNTVTRRYDDGWRRARRLMHQRFSKTAAEELWPTQEQEAHDFLKKLLSDDTRFMRTFREYVPRIYPTCSQPLTQTISEPRPLQSCSQLMGTNRSLKTIHS